MNNKKNSSSHISKINNELYKLSTEALYGEIDRIMNQDADTMDIVLLQQCLDLLQERNPVAIDTSPDDAWNEFVTQYPILTASENQKHKKRCSQSVLSANA